jgi:hypothetical protein
MQPCSCYKGGTNSDSKSAWISAGAEQNIKHEYYNTFSSYFTNVSDLFIMNKPKFLESEGCCIDYFESWWTTELRNFRLPPRCSWCFCSSVTLCSVRWKLFPTFWDSLSVPFSRVQQSLEHGTDRFSGTSINSYQYTLRNIAEQRRLRASGIRPWIPGSLTWKRNAKTDRSLICKETGLIAVQTWLKFCVLFLIYSS